MYEIFIVKTFLPIRNSGGIPLGRFIDKCVLRSVFIYFLNENIIPDKTLRSI